MKKRKDGRYCKTINIDGQRVFFYSTADSQKQAEKDIEKQMLAFKAQKHYDKHNFKAIAEKVIEEKELTASYKTVETYSVALKHLSPFYNKNIEDIKPFELQEVLNDMARQQYSSSAINKVKVLFSLVVKKATLQGIEFQGEYFLKAISIPKVPKHKTSSPDDKTIQAIIQNQNVPFSDWAMCLLFTGLRRGELAALQKQDVDFQANVIHITKSVEFVHNQPAVKPTPKTEYSIGDVPILSTLKPILLKLTKSIRKDDFLFGGNKPLSQTQIRKQWQKYCNTLGISIKGHQLRHAYATIIYRSGVDAKTAQRLLRHADFNVTMNIYTDFQQNVTAEAVRKIDQFTQDFPFCAI